MQDNSHTYLNLNLCSLEEQKQHAGEDKGQVLVCL